jgi:hypothetical protein
MQIHHARQNKVLRPQRHQPAALGQPRSRGAAISRFGRADGADRAIGRDDYESVLQTLQLATLRRVQEGPAEAALTREVAHALNASDIGDANANYSLAVNVRS